jgi:hypothetical protein
VRGHLTRPLSDGGPLYPVTVGVLDLLAIVLVVQWNEAQGWTAIVRVWAKNVSIVRACIEHVSNKK